MVQSVAFLGLGAMGWRMAAHLPARFGDVRVWNRTAQKAVDHAAQYGTRAVSLAEAVQAEVIFSCLPTSAEVEALIAGCPPAAGRIWVDCTSGVPEAAQRLSATLARSGVAFLDAPVSGQTVGAEHGTLTVMVGGDPDALARARVAIEPFAGLIQHVGGSGAGFAVKAVNNMMMAVNLWAAAEGCTILKAHGVDLTAALACINASSGQSVASANLLPNRVLSRSFPCTFALPLLAKDTGIALALAQSAQVPTPVMAQVQSLYRAAAQQATPADDFSTAIRWYEQWTGREIC